MRSGQKVRHADLRVGRGERIDTVARTQFLGCHQPHERVIGTHVFVAWFSKGLRVLDVANPYHPREVGHYEPPPAPGSKRTVSNDVWVDGRGLVYLLDRDGGLDILEWRG